MTAQTSPLCSDQRVEPLPGTAKVGTTFIAFEHAHGWGRDIMDGDAFGEETTARLAEYLKKHKAQLQLIRKPGREGQLRDKRAVYIAHIAGGQAAMHKLEVNRPEDLLDIDASAPVGTRITTPLVLVCTHGKRDQCCALKGRPLAAQLYDEFGGDVVWETSHTKGHRFAPSIIALPWGYSFGHLNASAAADMVRHLQRGELFLPGNRGRACWPPQGQVAELAVAERLVRGGEEVRAGQLHIRLPEAEQDPGRVDVTHPDGRAWQVRLQQQDVPGVISSCGAAPKTGSAWIPTEITDQSAGDSALTL